MNRRKPYRDGPTVGFAVSLLLGAALGATALAAPQITHVVQMSVDGLAAQYLQFYVTNAPQEFPTFARLTMEGAFTFNARCDTDFSETIPNHVSMFTARPVLQPQEFPATIHHGYSQNSPDPGETLHVSGNPEVTYKASMFDVAHDYGLSTAFYAGKSRLDICDRSYNLVNGAPDEIGQDNGTAKIDFSSVTDINGTQTSNQVNSVIENLTSTNPWRYIFLHLTEPDRTGHSAGWGTVAWSNAVRMVDFQLGRILEAIDLNPALANKTAFILTADHGGGGVTPTGHTEAYHITNYTIPFFLRAPGIPAGVDLYTLLANRGNPGTNRTDYTTEPQPIRDGDASNLALALLGLPPIPDSFMVPIFAAPEITLAIARLDDRITLFWTDPSGNYSLEAADDFLEPQEWQEITDVIESTGTTRTYSVANPESHRFFRLHKRGELPAGFAR